MKLVDKWLSRQFNGPEEEDEKPWVNDDKPQVIVVGFGRFGQVIELKNLLCQPLFSRSMSYSDDIDLKNQVQYACS